MLVVRPDAKSPAASKQVEFVIGQRAVDGTDCRQVPDSDHCGRRQRDSDRRPPKPSDEGGRAAGCLAPTQNLPPSEAPDSNSWAHGSRPLGSGTALSSADARQFQRHEPASRKR